MSIGFVIIALFKVFHFYYAPNIEEVEDAYWFGPVERHISTCLINFLDKHKLIYDNHSGFRCNYSCQTSLTKMVDNWFTAMNNNEIVGAVLLDLSKAFDLVNHQILKQKLSAYKFSHLSQRWFDSYLSKRF